MSEPKITLCICSWNAASSLALVWESYCKYNADFPAKLAVLDNGSWDGAREYAERHADLLLIGNNTRNHGVGLTELARRVDTEYLLTIDNDAPSVREGGVRFLMEHLQDDTWCVCPSRLNGEQRDVIDPRVMIGYSPNICIGLFRTVTLQKICKELDLGYAGDFTTGAVWETGGLAWRVARTHGLDAVELSEAWKYFDHFGNVSQIWHHIPHYPSLEGMNPALCERDLQSYFDRYLRVRRDLSKVRGCRLEELDAHEPPSDRTPVVETLDWKKIEVCHPFLRQGGGVR